MWKYLRSGKFSVLPYLKNSELFIYVPVNAIFIKKRKRTEKITLEGISRNGRTKEKIIASKLHDRLKKEKEMLV